MQYIYFFPGQGAQYIGMGQDLYDAYQEVRDLFGRASDVIAIDTAQLLFHGSEEELQSTHNTQIAVTLVNLAAAYALRACAITPTAVAGFSLGEYAAMVIAGILKIDDVFRVVQIRGKIMEEVSREVDDDSGMSGLIAVIGLSVDAVEDLFNTHTIENAYIAMHNSPQQIIIGGTQRALATATALLQQAGAVQVIRLKVSGPFHTAHMHSAKQRFMEAISDIPFADPALPMYSNVNGNRVESGAEMKALCAEQLVERVQWVSEQQSIVDDLLPANTALTLLEVGAGHVLRGLWRALLKYSPQQKRYADISFHGAGTQKNIKKLIT